MKNPLTVGAPAVAMPSRREPSYDELVKHYHTRPTDELVKQYDRLKRIQEQANKRCRAAMEVLSFRSKDNHQKPPTQIVRPGNLKIVANSKQ